MSVFVSHLGRYNILLVQIESYIPGVITSKCARHTVSSAWRFTTLIIDIFTALNKYQNAG